MVMRMNPARPPSRERMARVAVGGSARSAWSGGRYTSASGMSLMIWTAMMSGECKRFAFGPQRRFLSLCGSRCSGLADATKSLAGTDPPADQRPYGSLIMFQKRFSGSLYRGQQIRVAHEVGHPHLGKSRLAGAEQLA